MPRSMPMVIDSQKIEATVVINKKLPLDYNEPGDFLSGPADTFDELLGKRVSLRLVSAEKTDPSMFFFAFFIFLSSSFLCFE